MGKKILAIGATLAGAALIGGGIYAFVSGCESDVDDLDLLEDFDDDTDTEDEATEE